MKKNYYSDVRTYL